MKSESVTTPVAAVDQYRYFSMAPFTILGGGGGGVGGGELTLISDKMLQRHPRVSLL